MHPIVRPSPSPFRFQSRKGKWHCALCRCELANSSHAATVHEAGKRHLQNLQLKETPSYSKPWGSYCSVCDLRIFPVDCGYPYHYDLATHQNGYKHRANKAMREVKCRLELEIRAQEAAVMLWVIPRLIAARLSDELILAVLEWTAFQHA